MSNGRRKCLPVATPSLPHTSIELVRFNKTQFHAKEAKHADFPFGFIRGDTANARLRIKGAAVSIPDAETITLTGAATDPCFTIACIVAADARRVHARSHVGLVDNLLEERAEGRRHVVTCDHDSIEQPHGSAS
jgi:hypothetical protein